MHNLCDLEAVICLCSFKIMCNVSVVKHGPVCLGPAVQLCGMAGGDYFKLTELHTPVAQLPLVRRNVLSCEAVYFWAHCFKMHCFVSFAFGSSSSAARESGLRVCVQSS